MRAVSIARFRFAAVAASLVLAVLAMSAVDAGAATAAGGRHDQATTSEPATDAPPTTATPPPTTAPPVTVAPATTPSGTPATTVPGSTTSSSSSSTPWGAIAAIAAGVILIVLIVALLVRRRSRGSARRSWNTDAASALGDAQLVRDMLEGEAQPDQPEDATRQTAVRTNVERTASRFEQLATAAPNDNAGREASNVATSLRGYLFALEAERLLRTAPTPPTADQLASADATRRARASDLDDAISALRARIAPR
jgi:hypothetical protein